MSYGHDRQRGGVHRNAEMSCRGGRGSEVNCGQVAAKGNCGIGGLSCG